MDIRSFHTGTSPQNIASGRWGEIMNSTWTSQFVFKSLISFQRITFRTHRKPYSIINLVTFFVLGESRGFKKRVVTISGVGTKSIFEGAFSSSFLLDSRIWIPLSIHESKKCDKKNEKARCFYSWFHNMVCNPTVKIQILYYNATELLWF